MSGTSEISSNADVSDPCDRIPLANWLEIGLMRWQCGHKSAACLKESQDLRLHIQPFSSFEIRAEKIIIVEIRVF